MIASINSLVSKVVDTVKGPLHTWGPKNTRMARRPAKAARCRKSKCRNKKCKCS